ncbi:cysteine-type peptidase activity protein [Blastocladiella emersonii ATCC 22665]|nr:cysteine-type peptidase activity protein [Blastocladiella emersonii ATCC 22665]
MLLFEYPIPRAPPVMTVPTTIVPSIAGTPASATSLTITVQDAMRLNEPECINDTLIELYCKYLLDTLTQAHRAAVHCYSPYFYSLLARTGADRAAGYRNVARHTRDVDLFAKKLIIIPMYEPTQWYLAVVFNISDMIDRGDLATVADNVVPVQESATLDDTYHLGNETFIVILDSRPKSRHKLAADQLGDYFVREANARGLKVKAGYEVFKIDAKVPTQLNDYDSGVYVMHFIERILHNPRLMLKTILDMVLVKRPRAKPKAESKTATAGLSSLARIAAEFAAGSGASTYDDPWAATEIPVKRLALAHLVVRLTTEYRRVLGLAVGESGTAAADNAGRSREPSPDIFSVVEIQPCHLPATDACSTSAGSAVHSSGAKRKRETSKDCNLRKQRYIM